ncbi:MAG: cupredoxin domain-containing protein [Acidimicrobiales bacterium]
MTSKITATLVICAVAGGVAVGALARPASAPQQTVAAAPAPTAEAAPQADAEQGNGYGGGAAEPAAPAPAAAEPAVITIEGFAFSGSGTFQPGQTIEVVNADGAPHTLTANDGSFDTGNLDGGGRAQLTLPTTPGTYSFFCAVHPSMTGTLTVAG